MVLAGGSGTRVGADRNKVYLELAGRHVISWSFHWAAAVPEITTRLLVTRPVDMDLAAEVLPREVDDAEVTVIAGGATRHGSERAALDHLADRIRAGDLDLVAVHDGARPLAGPALLRSLISTAGEHGAAIPALPAPGVHPVAPDGSPAPAAGTRLVRVQTPQVARALPLLAAYDAAERAGFTGTDTASTLERFSDLPVVVVPGSPLNLKVTYPGDLGLAAEVLRRHPRLL
ncbi:MAG: 2-C-methyl-D-erythritol 4-phosphate cytidylyltransferase [Actinomycetales bacterium]|nr:2-C-methyl-D-erythritol 4-phosphate cytidylyltransferase [Actinomycetales bacterium]